MTKAPLTPALDIQICKGCSTDEQFFYYYKIVGVTGVTQFYFPRQLPLQKNWMSLYISRQAICTSWTALTLAQMA